MLWCYMLQCCMRHNRIHLAIAFHAICCKFLSSMLHAARMNMFIIVACSMLQIFSVVFVWPHATKSKENSLMTQENVQIKARIFFVEMSVFVLIKSFCSSWRTGMLQALPVSLMIRHLLTKKRHWRKERLH